MTNAGAYRTAGVLVLRRALKPDGRYVLIGHERYGASGKRAFGLVPHFVALMVRSRFVKQLRGPGAPALTKKQAIAILKGLLETGQITPLVDCMYPLSEVREAFRHMMEDELRGKVIVTPAEAV